MGTLSRTTCERRGAKEDAGIEETGNSFRNICAGLFYLARMEKRGLKIEDAMGRRIREKLSPMSQD